MTLPIASQQPPSPNWNVLPNHKHCPFFYSSTVRKVMAHVSMLGTVASAATYRWAFYNFTAAPITVIYTLRAVMLLTGAFAISTAAFGCLPASVKEPGERLRLRQAAGADIEKNGTIPSYPEIAQRYNKLIREEIITDADIEALMKRDLHTLSFAAFNVKHTREVVAKLSDDTKKLLQEKFFSDPLPAKITLKGLMANELAQVLQIKPTDLAHKLFNSPEWIAKIQSPDYTYENFISDHGEAAIADLPPDSKKSLTEKFSSFVLGQKLPLRDYGEKYAEFCFLNFGNQANVDLMEKVREFQINEMVSGKVTNYIDYRTSNGDVWFTKQLKVNSVFREAAKACFLNLEKTPYTTQISPDMAADRALLDLEVDQCIDAINEWADKPENTYLAYRRKHDCKRIGNLKPETQTRYKEQLIKHLAANPEQLMEFAEDMKQFGLTKDDIFIPRWKGMTLDEIVKKDSKFFLGIVKVPENIKEHLLRETSNRPAKEVMEKYPFLFIDFFTGTDRSGNPEQSYLERVEGSIKNYSQMEEMAKAFGRNFYTSGFISEPFVSKMVAYHLGNASISHSTIYNKDPIAVKAPVSAQIQGFIRIAREKVALARKEAESTQAHIKAAHEITLQTIKTSNAAMPDNGEKEALDLAIKADQPHQAAFEAAKKAFTDLQRKETAQRSNILRLEEDCAGLKDFWGSDNVREIEQKLEDQTKALRGIEKQLVEAGAEIATPLRIKNEGISLLAARKKEIESLVEGLMRRLEGPRGLQLTEQRLAKAKEELNKLQLEIVKAKESYSTCKEAAAKSAKVVSKAKTKFLALEQSQKEALDKVIQAQQDSFEKKSQEIYSQMEAKCNEAYLEFLRNISPQVNAYLKEDLSQADYSYQNFTATHSSTILHILDETNKALLISKFMKQDFNRTGTLIGGHVIDWVEGLGIKKLDVVEKMFATASHKRRIRGETYTWEFFCNEYGADCRGALPGDLKDSLPNKHAKP